MNRIVVSSTQNARIPQIYSHLTRSRAYTLVELIVVIAILVVLSTVGFVGYSQYTASSRDGARVSDLRAIYQGIGVSVSQKGIAPAPDTPVSIYASTGVLLSLQGSVGETVRQAIGLESGGRDPQDGVGYTYLRFKDKKSVQLLAMFEAEEMGAKIALGENGVLGESAYAATDYTDRYPSAFGKKLGVFITCSDNTPIEQNTTYTGSGINATSAATGSEICVIGNTGSGVSENLSGTWVLARVLSPASTVVASGGIYSGIGTSTTSPGISCLAIKTAGATTDGLYWIKPTSGPAFQAYCDMATDGGGWTLAARIKWDECTHMNPGEIGTVISISQATTAKFSDTMINGFSDKTLYRVTFDSASYSIYLNAISGDAFSSNDRHSFQSKDTYTGATWYGPTNGAGYSHVGPVTWNGSHAIPSGNGLVWWYTGCVNTSAGTRWLAGPPSGWDNAWALWIK